MIETLGTTLIVIFCVLIFIAQLAGAASFVMLILQGRKLKSLGLKLEEAKLQHDIDVIQLINAKSELIDGQFKLAELNTKGITAITEFVNKSAKEMVDSNFDAIEKNTEDVLKLNTQNSQKVYDAIVIMIQLMNGLMTALGYRPSVSVPESGLEDPKKGQNYGAPPAPGQGFVGV